MSSGKGHFVGGLVFLWLFLHIVSNYFFRPTLLQIFIYAVLVVLFALWPDVDIKSIGQKLFYTIFFAADAVLIYFEQYKMAAFLGLLIILPILANHRGWTHARITAVLLPVPLITVPMVVSNGTLAEGLPYYFAAVAGDFSHLFFDKKLI